MSILWKKIIKNGLNIRERPDFNSGIDRILMFVLLAGLATKWFLQQKKSWKKTKDSNV